MTGFRVSLKRVRGAIVSLSTAVLLWELAGRVGMYDTRLIPQPSTVLVAIGQLAVEGALVSDVAHTAFRVLLGFATGASLGFLVGLATGLRPRLRHFVEPLVQVARPVPAVALVPLSIAWFGVGELAKFFIVGWASFFPVWVNTHLGVQRVPRDLIWTATILRASRLRTIWEVVVPWAMPFVQAGARVALGLAFAATVVAEMSGASAGLGYRILASHLVFRLDRMIAAILLVGAFGATVDRAFVVLTRKLLPGFDVSRPNNQ